MDPESRKLLERSLNLAEENNHMLKKMRRIQKWAALWQTLKMLVIIGLALGSFYYIEPYLSKLVNVYNSISGTPQNSNSGSSSSFQDFFKKFTN